MNEFVVALRLRQLLLTLVLVLTFEGIVRKAAPPFLSVPLFLIKDLIVSIMAVYVLQLPVVPALAFLWKAYRMIAILFVPLILCTAWNDPILAVFGAKQYLLFPIVGFATFHAFQHSRMEEILTFFRKLSLLIIPTVVLALIQIRLPADNWLNMSVGGDTMEGFSAGGKLRVSSTFSFVAQYCTFLNAQAFILMIGVHEWRKRSSFWKMVLLSLIPLFLTSCFITGSRGAVAGNTAIIFLAAVLIMGKFEVKNFLRIAVFIFCLYFLVEGVNYFFPQATAAYSERENGHLMGISSEVQQRVFGSFFAISNNKALSTFFGNGLGIMSNGSETISNYAGIWRAYIWTESDFSSSLFEGGYYLAIIWYSFRIYVLFVTTRRYLKEITKEYTVPAAFIQAFVIIVGILGTLGMQPPVAIWWWMSVGVSLVFSWKCAGPPEPEIKIEPKLPIQPPKLVRGRSLYADVLHPPKE